MRLILVSIITLGLGSGAILAQTGVGDIRELSPSGAPPKSPRGSPASLTKGSALPVLQLLVPRHASSTISPDPSAKILRATPAEEISPRRQWSSRPLSPESKHDNAIADCMQMWDSRTHMTRQDWLRTCRRIQTRLDNLNLEAIMPKTKTQLR